MGKVPTRLPPAPFLATGGGDARMCAAPDAAVGASPARHEPERRLARCRGAARTATLDVSRVLIAVGLVIVAIGVLWPLAGKLGLGRLPGDIVIERSNYSVYVPIVTCLVLSLLLSAVLWLFNR
jgi:hypothetical protein